MMRSHSIYSILAAFSCTLSHTAAQTSSQCNPLEGDNCPPKPALGKSVKVDFTSGQSDSFTPSGNPTYNSEGASLTVAKAGDSPVLSSKWYIMFGHVEFVVKAAPGTGIVSSCVLQSDSLDEIDWEWLGGDNGQVQSNYFGRGKTLGYNRGAFHPAPGNQNAFRTYSIDWTADQIVWSINGEAVRALSSSTASQYPYPQTPMMVKVGAWCGGCSSNEPGTIEWAGGAPSFANGGSTMQVKSISVTDYSTGSQYKYNGIDGSWRSIEAIGGSVNPKGGKGSAAGANAPQVSTTSNTGPIPFQGTRGEGGWTPTTLQTSGTPTTYPGLPEGWTVTSSGKVLPPSAAAVTPPPSSASSLSQDSQQGSQAGGSEVAYDGQGFAINVPKGEKRYDDKGFLVAARSSPVLDAQNADPSKVLDSPVKAQAADESSSTSSGITKSTSKPDSGAPGFRHINPILATVFGLLAGMTLL